MPKSSPENSKKDTWTCFIKLTKFFVSIDFTAVDFQAPYAWKASELIKTTENITKKDAEVMEKHVQNIL